MIYTNQGIQYLVSLTSKGLVVAGYIKQREVVSCPSNLDQVLAIDTVISPSSTLREKLNRIINPVLVYTDLEKMLLNNIYISTLGHDPANAGSWEELHKQYQSTKIKLTTPPGNTA